MGFGDLRKLQKEAQALKKNPTESSFLRPWAASLAEVEHSLRERVRALEDAAGIDETTDTQPVDDRTDELLKVVGAMLNRNRVEHYVEEHTDVENAGDAVAYAGLNSEEWETQKQTWADLYRSDAPKRTEGMDTDDLAATFVEDRFGVTLTTFEADVVDIGADEVLRTIVAGPLEETEAALAEIEREVRE